VTAPLHYSDAALRDILTRVKHIALVGASQNDERPSHGVMRYLLARGYDVVPVNPGLAGQDLLGQTVYANLADIPHRIDMVDIFRTSDAALQVTVDALALPHKPSVIWMQLGVRNDEAARMAQADGVTAIMDRCPKIEIERLGLN
jgi:uncharacterized protein